MTELLEQEHGVARLSHLEPNATITFRVRLNTQKHISCSMPFSLNPGCDVDRDHLAVVMQTILRWARSELTELMY